MLYLLALQTPAFDWSGFGLSAITALVPVVTTVVVWAAKKALDSIPRALLPVSAVAVATVLDYLTTFISGHTFDPLTGAALGAAAVLLREFVNTLAEHGLDS